MGIRGPVGKETVGSHAQDRAENDGDQQEWSEPISSGWAFLGRRDGRFWPCFAICALGTYWAGMIGERVIAFGHLDQDLIVNTLGCIVFGQLRAKATGLDPHHRIDMGVEIVLTAEHFCCNLVLLGGRAGVLPGMIREIAQKLAERLRAMKSVATEESFDLFELLGLFRHGLHRAEIVTPK